MPREFPRSRRVAEEIQRALSEALSSELQDPRLGLVTVTDVELSRDLSHARIYFSAMGGSDAVADAQRALRAARGRLRHTLARQLKLRSIPELRFEYDDSMEKGARIDALLHGADPADGEGL